ncbi:hypothetical protein ABIF52_008696 [Bradyrhizobium japonicum]|uniref:hypothetical protein n=1 Tax=Bradyrhizobium diazoefficiens TaxID=1355477 RepID=UPI00347F2B62
MITMKPRRAAWSGLAARASPTEEDEARLEVYSRDQAKANFRAQLESSTVDELKAGAEQRGIDLKGATKKGEIIAAIVAWMDEREAAERAAAEAAKAQK